MDSRIEQIIRIAAAAVLVIGCLLVLKPFLGAIVSAAILCFSTWPLYGQLERRLGGRRTLAATAMTFLILVVLVLPLALVAASYADEVPDLVEHVRVLFSEGLPLPPDW